MLLIIFLGLVVNLTLGSDQCELGTPVLTNFDMNKVRIILWQTFYKKQLLKFLLRFIFNFSLLQRSVNAAYQTEYVGVIQWFMYNYLEMIWKETLVF
jgi:hypothetical protein